MECTTFGFMFNPNSLSEHSDLLQTLPSCVQQWKGFSESDAYKIHPHSVTSYRADPVR